ncbi:expressed unknown protein [Seminavis robusta]|uniref:Ubiquitin-like domain-containing protein n=1 Tax=Seminavis robusta TaxID=568900 RepID=A0A9N8HKS5_9STRA|nr:expressed unknown protein [Seminavis robusta]|eukprot:Sro861_g212340.1 n/a (158) ;mRNA; f:39919-40517
MAVIAQQRRPCGSLLQQKTDECSVFFNFVHGKTLCMMVNLHTDDIKSIKKRLAELDGKSDGRTTRTSFVLASRDMFLVWNGKPLEEDCTLADYNITSKGHTTIFCHQRQPGGCFAVSFSIFMVIVAAVLGSSVTCGASLILVPLLLPLLVILPFCCL